MEPDAGVASRSRLGDGSFLVPSEHTATRLDEDKPEVVEYPDHNPIATAKCRINEQAVVISMDIKPSVQRKVPALRYNKQCLESDPSSMANQSALELRSTRQSKKLARPRNSFVNFMNQASSSSTNNQSESQYRIIGAKLSEMDKVFKLRETQRMKIQNMREISKIFDAISDFKSSLADRKTEVDIEKVNNKLVLQGLFTHGKLQQLFNQSLALNENLFE